MADTVKKSRIVSDEENDLEESLLEEFNIRLKNCMSQDDLQKDADPPEPDEIYESIPSPPKPSPKSHIVATETFLQTEIQQENHYDEPRSLLNNVVRHNGHDDVISEPHEEEIYENIPEKTETLDQQYVQMVENKIEDSLNVDLSPQKSQHEEYEPMGLEDTSSNLYESVELKFQSVEPVEPKKLTPTLNLPTTLFTDYSEQKSPDGEVKCSAKDRMFLSDETSTLLFTQTVTSPMLTPSEENIDFLKGFQRDNTISESTVSNSSPPKETEEKFETTETSPDVSDPLEEEKVLQSDNIYENTEHYKNTTPENTYENLVSIEKEENIYEHLDDIKSEVQKLEGKEDEVAEVENIYQNIEECLGDIKEQIVVKNGGKSQDTDDGSLEEFIRNEKEVSESFLVTEKTSKGQDVKSKQEILFTNEHQQNVEVVEQKIVEQDVVDRVQNTEEVGKQEIFELKKINQEYDDNIMPGKNTDQEIVHLNQENHKVITTFQSVQKTEDIIQNTQKSVDIITNGQKNVDELQKNQKSPETVKESSDSAYTVQKVSTKESKEKISTETYKELIYHQKLETNSNYCEKYSEVVTKSSKSEMISNREKDTETVPAEIVKNLKSQFQNKAGAEVVGIVKKGGGSKKESSVIEVKSANMINQMKTRFEAGTDSGDDKKVDDSTEYSETIVETNAPGERCIKKKKVKKTRKEEKENISVTQNGNVDGENFYNVNVKSLCRSFGDLTKIEKDRNNKKNVDNRTRTKSLTDMVSHSNIKNIENVFSGVSVRNLKERFNSAGTNNKKCPFTDPNLKSSFSKFDALQKKNVLHVRSSDSTKAQEKFSNGTQIELATNCKACGKQVFQMEQIKAEKSLWHKNCFRCTECSKQLTVDTYESNDGSLYCKPHFKALFAPKAVEDEGPPRPRRHEPIIRENQPLELPPGVVRASDKPDLGLEELQSLNVKERFQVFEHYQTQQTETSASELERGGIPNVKRSPSILSKLARFQKHGMDVGVSNEALDGVPIEESSSEEEEEQEVPEGEDPDLVRAKKIQKEKPFHFTGMSDVKKRWEQGDHAREERREETKQEIQNIRTRLFMGKQEKMKEAYQNAIMESESSTNLRKNNSEKIEVCDTKSIKERFEKGEVANERINREISRDGEEEVYESEISKKSRSLFLELDASASKAPQVTPVTPPKLEVKKAREAYLEKTSKEDTVKSTEQMEEIEVRTADIQEKFKFFETYKEPEKHRKQFRITPPRDPSQVKTGTPEREIYRDPDVVRSEEYIDDSKIAKESHTASKMLNKFREMEENLAREPEPQGLKPLKCFTPPPEPARPASRSEEEESSEYEEEEEEVDQPAKLPEDLIEAQKAARAKQLRAKFEKWEVNEIKREQQQNSVNIVEEFGEEQSQVESTRVLRAKFEQMRDSSNSDSSKASKIKPNRFVEMSPTITETCQSCSGKVYPLEKISIHGNVYHKNCFKCMECSCVLRMDSYSYNQGLLYCTPHFKRLFISKGNYDSAFGLDQHKEKWQNSVNNMTVA